MSAEHVPTTEDVRESYAHFHVIDMFGAPGIPEEESRVAFDRWLDSHTAQVRAEVAEQIAQAVERSSLRRMAHLRPHEVIENLAREIREHGGTPLQEGLR